MSRYLKLVAILVLAVGPSVATAQPAAAKALVSLNVAKKVAQKMPLAEWFKWMTDLADEATKKDSAIVAKVLEKGFREKARICRGCTETVDVVVEQTTSFWRGSVSQRLTMPCTATVAIELDQLLGNATMNPETKTIEITLPPLSIIAVESQNAKSTAAPEYSGGCWAWYDSGTAANLELGLLKSDWSTLARGRWIQTPTIFVRQSPEQVTQFLQGLLRTLYLS